MDRVFEPDEEKSQRLLVQTGNGGMKYVSGALLEIYHSVIQYPAESRVSDVSFRQTGRRGHLPAKVMNTIKPITLADEQPPALLPLVQAGFEPPLEGSYFTYTF